MIEKLPVPARFPRWMPDQNPRPEDSQSPEALGPKRFVTRELDLQGTDVPTWFGRFDEVPRLRRLQVRWSSAEDLPDEIAQLRQLKTLIILNMNLSKFPLWICRMTQLRELTVRGTNISRVPDELANLIHLRKLELGNNLLRRCAVDLRGCTDLQCLLIADNDLEELPSKLPPETTLGLAGTPFRTYTGCQVKELPLD